MGNSQTKESRRQPTPTSPTRVNNTVTVQPGNESTPERPPSSAIPTRTRRGSRPDLSFLGIGGIGDEDDSILQNRRESKAEREARKVEKEKIARLEERKRSMREEHVDGGYLVTQGVYVGAEDFDKVIVRQLMVFEISAVRPSCVKLMDA